MRLGGGQRLEQFVHEAGVGIGRGAGVNIDQQVLALGVAQQVQARDRLRVVGRHGAEQANKMGGDALHAGFVEQVARVFEHAGDLHAVVRQLQAQVEVGAHMLLGDAAHGQPAQAQGRFAGRSRHAEQSLEQRTVAHAARRLQSFDHLFERQVLMLEGGQGVGFDLRQQLRHRRVLVDAHAQRQRVGEKADQPFDLAALAVRHRRADDDIVLARQARQQDRPGSQQGHEQRGAVPLAERMKLGG